MEVLGDSLNNLNNYLVAIKVISLTLLIEVYHVIIVLEKLFTKAWKGCERVGKVSIKLSYIFNLHIQLK